MIWRAQTSRATISRLLGCVLIAPTISSAFAGGYSNPMFSFLRRLRSIARVMLVLIACSLK